MQFTIEAAVRNHIGKVRKNNEDNFFCNGLYLHRNHLLDGGYVSETSTDNRQIYAVCDGMGGEKDGEEASLLAVQNLERLKYVLDNGGKPKQNIDAFCDDTNRGILTYGQGGHMGTTLVMACFHEQGCELSYLGDSRIYLIRNKGIKCLTNDHSEVNRLKMMGLINEDEAQNHPDRNMLNKYLGMQYTDLIIRPEYVDYDPKQGDRLLLCSDGISDMLSDSEIYQTVMDSRSASTATKNLVNKALKNGGKDNITAMVLILRRCSINEKGKTSKKKKRKRGARRQTPDINWYNQDELDRKGEGLFTAGRKKIIRPIALAIIFLLVLGAAVMIALNFGDGIESIKQLFRGQIKVENSVDVVGDTEILTPDDIIADEPETELTESDQVMELVSEAVSCGLTHFDISQVSSDDLLMFAVAYACSHAEEHSQFSRAPVSIPGDLEATEANLALLDEIENDGCYRITQQEVDEILMHFFNVVLEPSNSHAVAVYKDGTYFIAPSSAHVSHQYTVSSSSFVYDKENNTYVVDYEFMEGDSVIGNGTATVVTDEGSLVIEQMLTR